jgi:hypothetical protein
MTYRLGCTRFNLDTWRENEEWRKMNKYTGCIYGTPREMKPSIPIGATIFVFEMHNDENKIKAIGIITKELMRDKFYRIYKDRNYNRYVYKGRYRVDVENLSNENKNIIEKFNMLIFKTKKHIKRGQGITEIPKWMMNEIELDCTSFCLGLMTSLSEIN